MPVLVSSLLAEASLQLTVLAGGEHAQDRTISWVATTELTDPVPFLRGGELVCTTALQERTDEQWRALVQSLAAVPVAALCVGTGLVRPDPPPGLVAAARDHGLVLVESPVSVPFIQISRWVADRIFAEHYEQVRSGALAQDELLRELLAGRSLSHLLRTLGRHLGPGVTSLMVVDGDNRVIAAHRPPRPAPGATDHASTLPPPDTAPTDVPILVDGEALAYVRCHAQSPRLDILSSAANILGLEIARRQAVLAGRRALAGQVVEDIIDRTGSETEAVRRLGELGLSTSSEHRVVVGRARQASTALHRDPMTIGRLFDASTEPHLTATVHDDVVIVVPGAVEVGQVAQQLLVLLRHQDGRAAVGIGSSRTGVAGIRRSYQEAVQGVRRGSGLHECASLSVTEALLNNAPSGVDEAARTLLQPVLDHDRQHGSALVSTLEAWFEHSCSPADTGAALHLHRNSLRYRLDQVARLTGKDLSNLQDRFELWFALQYRQP